MPQFTAADAIRILIATDSHIGYEERDPIRKDDSWQSFDEVMSLAKSEDVDMVFLAGDLFHDNRPSRKSMFQCMRSLRRNCLGEKPCELELLSDSSAIFDGAFNTVNYEDPDINVAIPVFSIHGNHDDPTGDGHYCALDLLQVSGLLNYIGRVQQSDKLEIKPVLLQKGKTKLALYGMSNVRDERLFRTFKSGNVKFFKPTVQQSDWFHLMAVHQNHHAHSETGYLPENFLPEFMDLIVWGHEHECLIDPRRNSEMMFDVIQPGSSVATSLVPGEAVPKHVAVVKVTGREFTIEKKIRLKTVRPFITRELILSQDKRFKNLAKQKDNRSALTVELKKVVEELIEEAKEDWLAIQAPSDDEDYEPPAPDKIPLPLVRLKVEYTAPEGSKFDVENPQRFSNRFVNQVANVNDVVQFYRKKQISTKKSVAKDEPDDAIFNEMGLDTVKVDKLVQEYLTAQSLRIIPQAPFGDAVSQFVDKDDKHAMETFVHDSLKDQVKGLLAMEGGEDEEDDLDNAMERFREKQEKAFLTGGRKIKRKTKYKPRPENWDSDLDGEWEDQPAALILSDNGEEDTPAPAARRGRAGTAASDEDSVLGTKTKKAAPAKKAPAKKAPAAKKTPAPRKTAAKAKAPAKAPARGRKKAVPEPSEDEDDDVIMLDDDDDDEPPPPPKAQPKRAAAAKTRQTQLAFSQPSQATQRQTQSKTQIELSDDVISDDDDAFEPAPTSSRKR